MDPSMHGKLTEVDRRCYECKDSERKVPQMQGKLNEFPTAAKNS